MTGRVLQMLSFGLLFAIGGILAADRLAFAQQYQGYCANVATKAGWCRETNPVCDAASATCPNSQVPWDHNKVVASYFVPCGQPTGSPACSPMTAQVVTVCSNFYYTSNGNPGTQGCDNNVCFAGQSSISCGTSRIPNP